MDSLTEVSVSCGSHVTVNILPPCVFFAGKTKVFLDNCEMLTSDPSVLDTVVGCHIDIPAPCDLTLPSTRVIKVNSQEELFINQEINRLLQKGVVILTAHSNGECISSIFTRLKSDGSYRIILNLKEFNKNVIYEHFKMESLSSAIRPMRPNCFMASIHEVYILFSPYCSRTSKISEVYLERYFI